MAPTERLAMACYSGCYRQYGHRYGDLRNPHVVRDIEEAWRSISEEQRRMWRDCAAATLVAAGVEVPSHGA